MGQLSRPERLLQNEAILSEAELATADALCAAGQEHLFKDWPAPGTSDSDKRRMIAQAADINAKYPGGIMRYVVNGRKLLADSSAGVNPFQGFTPSVPVGETLHFNSDELDEAEELGSKEFPYLGFVLVAGGLGERLGYNGIKIALPCDIVSETPLIQNYIEYILAYQARARVQTNDETIMLPLAIMTSDDTHEATVALMEAHSNFGMKPNQITIVKQDKVPALADNAAHFVLSSSDQYSIVTKPHGHGDVHTLLHQNGVISRWISTHHTRYVFFFQDTNVIVFRAFPAALGMSVKRGFEVNSLTVPRRPGEAVGAICTLTSEKATLTLNVEYNQLDPLLRATVSPDGDVRDPKTGFSPYPGNINALILAAEPYNAVLERCGGSVPEFINPKYADSAKTIFKSPTRLECMMQDYPRLLGPTAKVGFTQLDRFMSFSAIKNNIVDGVAKHDSTGFSETAAAAESDLYLLNSTLMRLAGPSVCIENSRNTVQMAGIPITTGPRIVLSPAFAVTQQEMREALRGSNIKISERSSLLLKGQGRTNLTRLQLDGALTVDAVNGSTIALIDCRETNDGMELQPVDVKDPCTDQRFAVRGYRPLWKGQRLIQTEFAGEVLVVNDNV